MSNFPLESLNNKRIPVGVAWPSLKYATSIINSSSFYSSSTILQRSHHTSAKMPPQPPPDPKFGNLNLADARLLASIIKNSKVDQTSWDAVNKDIGRKGRAAPERWFALRRRVPLLEGVRIPVRAKPRRGNEAGGNGAQIDRQQQQEEDSETVADNGGQDLGVAGLSLDERNGESKEVVSNAEGSEGKSSESEIELYV
jgi:hypothetical protein